MAIMSRRTSSDPAAPAESAISDEQRIAPLTAEASTAFAELVHDAWLAAGERSQRFPRYNQAPAPLDEAAITDAIDFIEGKKGADSPDFARSVRKRLPPASTSMWESAEKLASRADLHLIHVVRLVSVLHASDAHFPYLLKIFALNFYFSHMPRFSIRQLAATLEAVGKDPEEVRNAMFSCARGPESFLKFDADDVWPYFAEHPDVLLVRWHECEDYALLDDRKREDIFKILGLFPTLPPTFLGLCWDVALGGTKKMRPLAQAALANEAGKENRILAALSARNAEHRSIAATWLASLGFKEAIPALKQALVKEKQELTAGSIMVALESLGVPLDEFINTDGLLKEAQALLAKGVHKDLAWFDLDHLPGVRWAQTGEPVRREILQWMIVQSYKLAAPEPGPRLRKYVSFFDWDDAQVFGQHVLESWIARDTVPHTPEQAHEAAEKLATQIAGFAHHYPQQFPGGQADWYRQAYIQKLLEPTGSAQKEKGILAVAAACCGPRAVLFVEHYLKTYYGYRAHQCRALIRMLSWIDHPSAIQLLLSVSSRFRTASIRKEAEACVKELAERKNWTIAELADRTIPTAGFDDALQLVVDFGSRTFTASLDDELKFVLRSDDGKLIKTLPAPRKDDDAAKASAAKKTLSAARKEIDSVLKHQKERLYESMCTQRTWIFSDWDRFLNKHPIVRHYCQLLVWCRWRGSAHKDVPPSRRRHVDRRRRSCD